MNKLLQQPEYVHVLLQPMLTHALPLAAVGLLIALLARSRAATILALILVAATAAAVWPTVHYGDLAHDRVQGMADDAGGDWLAIHSHRADENAWIFYAVAVTALAALFLPRKWPKATTPLAWVTLAIALAASGVASYIAYAGGKIRHREFRNSPPPPAELREAQQDKD
ncbi:MAG: hypothetical protein KGJ37_07605 [Verrucomicrobiota bacterium]|nr:hypothetical protein [Verrucomicrobiota bacterium]